MPRISISETDLTRVGTFGTDTEVVYVPGLVNPKSHSTIPYGEPVLFTSVSAFQKACGNPYVFTSAVKFSDLIIDDDQVSSASATADDGDSSTDSGNTGIDPWFSDYAVPSDDVMFKAGSVDPGYLYAVELLNAGLSVMYRRLNPEDVKASDINIVNIYNWLGAAFGSVTDEDGNPTYSDLTDKGNYNFKYITSGGYPVFEYAGSSIASSMLTLAENRGDCVALIDHTNNPDRQKDINLDGSLYKEVNKAETFGSNSAAYGAMFTPYATYNITTGAKFKITYTDESGKDAEEEVDTTSYKTSPMPASFGYLLALGSSIKSNASWLAVAGAARGGVPNLATGGMTTVIPNGIADMMQDRKQSAINCITNIRPYGQVIWGNRTLYRDADLVARSFLNIRNLVSDVKKVCYDVGRSLTFEPDNDVTWINFKGSIAPTLDRMVSGYGISGYKIVRDEARAEAALRATICAQIYLYPVYPVEDFYINIVLTDDEVTVE